MTFDHLIVGSIYAAVHIAPALAELAIYNLTVRLRDAWARR